MADCRLIDVDHSLALHHLSKKHQGELLPLDHCGTTIGPRIYRLEALEFEAEVVLHNVTDPIVLQDCTASKPNCLDYLVNILNAAVRGHNCADSVEDGSNLLAFLCLLRLFLLDELHSSSRLAGYTAHHSDGDAILLGNILALALLN